MLLNFVAVIAYDIAFLLAGLCFIGGTDIGWVWMVFGYE